MAVPEAFMPNLAPEEFQPEAEPEEFQLEAAPFGLLVSSLKSDDAEAGSAMK